MSERVVYLNEDTATLVQEAEKIGVKKLLHIMQLLKRKNISIDQVIASVEKAYALPEDLKTSLQEFEKKTSERINQLAEHLELKSRLLSDFGLNKRDDCEKYNEKKGVCSFWTWDTPPDVFKSINQTSKHTLKFAFRATCGKKRRKRKVNRPRKIAGVRPLSPKIRY